MKLFAKALAALYYCVSKLKVANNVIRTWKMCAAKVAVNISQSVYCPSLLANIRALYSTQGLLLSELYLYTQAIDIQTFSSIWYMIKCNSD